MIAPTSVNINAVTQVLGVDPLTSQEEAFVAYILKGCTAAQAGRQVGLPSSADWGPVLAKPNVSKVVDYGVKLQAQRVQVTRDQLNLMLFEAHRKAGTATEEIMAVRELGKLNGLYQQQEQQEKVINSAEALRDVDDSKLLEMAEMADYVELPSGAVN